MTAQATTDRTEIPKGKFCARTIRAMSLSTEIWMNSSLYFIFGANRYAFWDLLKFPNHLEDQSGSAHKVQMSGRDAHSLGWSQQEALNGRNGNYLVHGMAASDFGGRRGLAS